MIITALPLLSLAHPTCSTRIINRSPAPPRIPLPRKYRPSLTERVWQSRTRNILSDTHIPPTLQFPLPLGLLRGFSRKPRSTFDTISTAPSVTVPHYRPTSNTYPTLLTIFQSPLPNPLILSPPSLHLPPSLKLRKTTRSKELLLAEMRMTSTNGPSGASEPRPRQASAGKAASHH